MLISTPKLTVGRLASCWLVLSLCCAPPLYADSAMPKNYALLIGVDRYQNEAGLPGEGVPKLEYAVRDARELAAKLERQGFETTLLKNENATRQSIISELVRIAEIAQPADTFLLYYAGHGIRRERTKQVYWLNYDGEPARPDVYGLRAQHLLQLVEEVPAGRKLVLLDHCYGGQIVQELGARAPGARDAGGPHVRARVGELIPEDLPPDLMPQFAGTVVVAASRGVAFELTEKQHGIFTYALLAAMRSGGADTVNPTGLKDGALSVRELIDYLADEVETLSRAKQLEQRPMAQTKADLASLTRWKPLLRELDPAEVPERATRYREQLRRWVGQQRIGPEVRDQCELVLARWESRPDLLTSADEEIVYTLRRAIDSPPAVPEEVIAAAVSGRVLYLVAGGP